MYYTQFILVYELMILLSTDSMRLVLRAKVSVRRSKNRVDGNKFVTVNDKRLY